MNDFFEVKISARLGIDELKAISEIVNINEEKYDSNSHFIRCAIVQLIRKEKPRFNQ